MAGFWRALRRMGRSETPAATPTTPTPEDGAAPARPALRARKTTTASGRPHLVVRKAATGKRVIAAIEQPDARGSEKVKAIRMRTKSAKATTTKRALVARRRSAAKGGLAIVARKEEAITAIRESFRDLGGSLRQIQAALHEDQARTQAVAEKLHHVPEILGALPAIAERQQACLDRMADRTEALAVIPKALSAVHEHAKAQIATLVAIREHLERRALREEKVIARLGEVSQSMQDVSDQAQAQIDEIRTLGEGQRRLVDGVRDLGHATATEMQRQNEVLWNRVDDRDRQRRNRLVAVAAGLGLGLAALGAVAAHAGANTLRSMQRSSQVLAETATRDLAHVRGELKSVGDLERRIAEREDELRLCLTAARSELSRSRQAHAAALAQREAELDQLRGELATLKGRSKSMSDPKAPSLPGVPTVRE